VAAGPGELSLFLHRVRDLLGAAPVTCDGRRPVADVARLMVERRIGSVIVVGDDGAPLGIVTDRDLRAKVVARERNPRATPAAAIMSAPLVTTGPETFLFEALLEMTRLDVHHLPVLEDGRLVGVLSGQDFLRLQTAHPVTLAREIGRAASAEALAGTARRVTELVRRLAGEGGTAHDIGQIVAELNDRLVARVLELTAAALAAQDGGAAPVPFAWLLFGSEARREQTLRTDQDNGLVYADPPPELAAAAAGYFARFAAEAIRGLVAVGFPECPGGIMASNPRWCQPLAVWREYFRGWMIDATPAHLLAASIHFDLRPLGPAPGLADALGALIRGEAPGQRRFLTLLARDVVDRRVPLTVFGNLAVRRDGPRRGTVDVKGGGCLQLVGAGRIHALELALGATSTVARFRAAGAQGLYPEAVVREVTDAYQLLLRLRLTRQLEALATGAPPDNDVTPRRLSHADRLLLTDALGSVGRVQAGLRERFATDFAL
jgi:CBS domain-containing protein